MQNKNISYQIKLDNFEGPLDLLLFLIKKNEVDIYDIPIALITGQYLEFVSQSDLLDLEVAGEFILMAATLMRIKSQMLLPRPALSEEGEEVDPRTELVEKLLDYMRFKEISEHLKEMEDYRSYVFPRGFQGWELFDSDSTEDPSVESLDITLNDLLKALQRVIAEKKLETFHPVSAPEITIEEKIFFVREVLKSSEKVLFADLFTPATFRLEIVVTFIALLEMVRLREVFIRQSKSFHELWVYANEGQQSQT